MQFHCNEMSAVKSTRANNRISLPVDRYTYGEVCFSDVESGETVQTHRINLTLIFAISHDQPLWNHAFPVLVLQGYLWICAELFIFKSGLMTTKITSHVSSEMFSYDLHSATRMYVSPLTSTLHTNCYLFWHPWTTLHVFIEIYWITVYEIINFICVC